MITKLIIPLLVLLLLLFNNCGEDYCDEGVFFLEKTVSFEVVDKGNGKDLLAEVNVYDKDSVKLLIDGIDILDVECIRNSYCVFEVENRKLDLTIYNDSLYFLYLNANDIDTIQMFAVRGEHFCLEVPQSEIINFIHNGDTLFNEQIGNRDFIKIKK